MKPIGIFKSGIHLGEEKIIEGNQASGMISFTGCHLACSFCYTPETSVHELGTTYTAAEMEALVDELVLRGARNLNLISPTHLWEALTRPLLNIKLKYGKRLPIVLKISGYESRSLTESISTYGDILVPDFKVFSEDAAKSVNLPRNYGEIALSAIHSFLASHGFTHYTDSGRMTHGMLVRHLMMPGYLEDSLAVINALGQIGYAGHLNLMTYFVDREKKSISNANPGDVCLLATAAQANGMRVLVNGQSRPTERPREVSRAG